LGKEQSQGVAVLEAQGKKRLPPQAERSELKRGETVIL
jgi:hypothetical protein